MPAAEVLRKNARWIGLDDGVRSIQTAPRVVVGPPNLH